MKLILALLLLPFLTLADDPVDCAKYTDCRGCFGSPSCHWCGVATGDLKGKCILGNDTLPLIPAECPQTDYYTSFQMCGATSAEIVLAMIFSIIVLSGTVILFLFNFCKNRFTKSAPTYKSLNDPNAH